MFKVHERFSPRVVWIRASEILKVYQVEDEDYTVIEFKNGEYMYVAESVDILVGVIDMKDKQPMNFRLFDSRY